MACGHCPKIRTYNQLNRSKKSMLKQFSGFKNHNQNLTNPRINIAQRLRIRCVSPNGQTTKIKQGKKKLQHAFRGHALSWSRDFAQHGYDARKRTQWTTRSQCDWQIVIVVVAAAARAAAVAPHCRVIGVHGVFISVQVK